MTPDEYLQVFRKHLNGFSREIQAALIEEIGSHIESGEEDPRMGKDPAHRRQKLMAELGAPGQLGKGFKRIYQPGKLIDFLLIIIPLLINANLNLLLVSQMPKFPWADVRVIILFHILLVAMGLWRNSILLTLFWLPRIAVQALGVILFTSSYYGPVQNVSLTIIFAGSIYLLGRIIWHSRRDILIVIYAILPLIIGVLGIALTSQMNLFDYYVYMIFYRIPSLDLIEYGMLALFFFSTNREIRWAALAVSGLLMGSFVSQPSFVLWIILPLATVSLGWWLDRSTRRQLGLVLQPPSLY